MQRLQKNIKSNLRMVINLIHWIHISRPFKSSSTKKNKRVEVFQNYKLLEVMGKKLQHETKRAVHNFSSINQVVLKSLCHVKLWIFRYHRKHLNLETIYYHLNYFYNNDNKDESLLYLKIEILGCLDVGLSSYGIYNKKHHHYENLLQEEYDAFTSLTKNKNNIIQEADKGTQLLQSIEQIIYKN